MSGITYRGFEDSSVTDFDHWVRSGTRVLRWSDDFLKYSKTNGPFKYSMTVELDGLTGEVTYREKNELEEKDERVRELSQDGVERYNWLIGRLDDVQEECDIENGDDLGELYSSISKLNNLVEDYRESI